MYHVKGSSMKNFKRIAALAGVVILLLIFCLPMAFAWGSSENAQALFRGAFAAAVLVPIVAYVFWMAYRIWGNKKPREDENRMIENIIFDVGNVLMGYDWEEYLRSYDFPEEKYQKIADAVFRNPIWEEQDRGQHEESWYVDKFVESAPEYEADIREVVRLCGNLGEISQKSGISSLCPFQLRNLYAGSYKAGYVFSEIYGRSGIFL